MPAGRAFARHAHACSQVISSALRTLRDCELYDQQFPKQLQVSLVLSRAAREASAPAFFDTCWPRAQRGDEGGFDVLQPRLRDIAERPDKDAIAFKHFQEEFMAKAMSAQDIDKLTTMAELVGENGAAASRAGDGAGVAAASRASDGAGGSPFQNLVDMVLGVAAVVQPSAATPEQLAAFRTIEDDRCSFMAPLAPLWSQSWWRSKCAELWTRSAHEAIAQPQMAKVLRQLRAPGASDHDEAWASAQKLWASWAKRCRPGATVAIEAALLQNAAAAWQGQPCLGAASPERKVEEAEKLRSRTHWLSEVASGAVPDGCRRLLADVQGVIDEVGGAMRLKHACALLTEMDGALAAFASIPGDMCARLHTELRDTSGLRAPERSRGSARRVLCHMATQTLTRELCETALAILEVAGPAAAVVGQGSGAASPHAGEGGELANGAAAPSPTAHDGESPGGATASDDAGAAALRAGPWAKALLCFDMHELLADESGQGRQERQARVAEMLAEWASVEQHEDLQGFAACAPSIQGAPATLAKQNAATCAGAVAEAKRAYEAALEAMEARAGGGDERKSWKANLSATSTWEEILHEAQYMLLKPPGMEAALGALKSTLTAAFAQYQRAASAAGQPLPCEDKERMSQAVGAAEATACEAFFIHTFATMPPGRRRTSLIRSRVAAMGAHAVNPDEILEPIFERVQSESRGAA